MAKGVPLYKLTCPDRPFRESATVLLVRLNEMLEWAGAIHDVTCVEELHNMRIAAKRLRYTMELFLPTLGQEAKLLLKTVESIQDQLGAIHDCDVLIPLLQETMEKEMNRERKKATKPGAELPPFLAAEGLVRYMHQQFSERARRYNEFIAFWDALPPSVFANRLTNVLLNPTKEDNSSEETLS